MAAIEARGTGRGRRLGLTREKVTAAALSLIDREGPDAFSLRRLAGELGIEPMSLYNHVPNKDALLGDVAESLLGQVEFAGTETGTWQERLRAHATAFRAAALRHPKAFPLVLTRPAHSPAVMANIRAALASIDELGLPPQEQVYIVRACVAYIAGTIMRELGSVVTAGAMQSDQVGRRIDEIAATGDPLLVNAAPYLAVSDHEAEFRYGLELLITGLSARVGTIPPTTHSPRVGAT
jgi:AcrR family transcriptional regulator